MQKDFHYYVTHYLALKAGLSKKEAQQIAWSDQFTDDCTDKKKYGIQTACGVLDDWWKKSVQRDVIMPFHFLPGDDPENKWVVTPNSNLCQILCKEADFSGNPYRIGIALHSMQDTFSHQRWTGWEDKFNEVYWCKHFPNPLPNVGHVNMLITPDVVGAVWTDLRNGERIINYNRFVNAEYVTFELLSGQRGAPVPRAFYDEPNYEKRKKILMKAGNFGRYSKIKVTKSMLLNFREAAQVHLNIVKEWIK